MILRGRRFTLLQTLALALGTLALLFSSTVAYGRYQTRQCGQPAVTVLGSGRQLSLLVADGPARLLLATGDDSSAFGNALKQVRPLGCGRIDVLLLAGTTNDVTFLTRARRAAKGRHVEAIGKPDLLGALGLPPDSLLPTPRRFRLSADTRLTVETVARADAKGGPSFAWRATIEHGRTRVVVLSDGRAAGDFPDPGPVSTLVVGGAEATAALGQIDTRVFVTSATEVSGKTARDALRQTSPDERWLVRVYPGEAKRFAFTERGLELPAGVGSIEATPEVARSGG